MSNFGRMLSKIIFYIDNVHTINLPYIMITITLHYDYNDDKDDMFGKNSDDDVVVDDDDDDDEDVTQK